MLAESFRDLIVNNVAAVALLGTWEFTSGAPEASVFTDDRSPSEGERPCVNISEAGGSDEGVRGFPGRDAIVSVRVMGNKGMSQKVLRETAEAVHDALHRKTTEFNTYTEPRGYEGIAVLANSPEGIEDENEFPGYLIVCRAIVLKL